MAGKADSEVAEVVRQVEHELGTFGILLEGRLAEVRAGRAAEGVALAAVAAARRVRRRRRPDAVASASSCSLRPHVQFSQGFRGAHFAAASSTAGGSSPSAARSASSSTRSSSSPSTRATGGGARRRRRAAFFGGASFVATSCVPFASSAKPPNNKAMREASRCAGSAKSMATAPPSAKQFW